MMLIDTLNAEVGGKVGTGTNTNAADYITNQKMTRFIFRNAVTATPNGLPGVGFSGAQITPLEAATWTNTIQEMEEATRLGIPAIFKSNARNHYERNARAGINEPAGSFSEWPKESGLAAAVLGMGGDMTLIKEFGQIIGEEWKAIGLRGMYGYMADVSTEPRWYRVHETFTENADLCANIIKTLVENMQGGPVNPKSPVVLTVKHFPGGGPQAPYGQDPHYTFGKLQVYTPPTTSPTT